MEWHLSKCKYLLNELISKWTSRSPPRPSWTLRALSTPLHHSRAQLYDHADSEAECAFACLGSMLSVWILVPEVILVWWRRSPPPDNVPSAQPAFVCFAAGSRGQPEGSDGICFGLWPRSVCKLRGQAHRWCRQLIDAQTCLHAQTPAVSINRSVSLWAASSFLDERTVI